MIRWNQAKIHKERKEREDQLTLLKMEYEATVNFLTFIKEQLNLLPNNSNALFEYLEKLAITVEERFTEPMRKESISKMKNWPQNLDLPEWGPVLKSHVPWHEEIKEILTKCKQHDQKGLIEYTLDLFEISLKKFSDRQPIIKDQISKFENDISKKLTMDNLKTGFDKTMVSKPKPKETVKQIETIHEPATEKLNQDVFLINLER